MKQLFVVPDFEKRDFVCVRARASMHAIVNLMIWNLYLARPIYVRTYVRASLNKKYNTIKQSYKMRTFSSIRYAYNT